ncbi:MAG TPA: HD domain-containing protein [Candidatus Saccharimonadales bacterium]
MIISDKIYGEVNIKSEVILELINSKPLQRLKGIGQYGIPDEFYHHKNYSRYDHSVGVMLLLGKLGASEEEQIAGLLHDVSHTAFSHVIDWVVGEGGAEGYQDEQHENYILKSEIPSILEKHNYSVERITDYHHFGLLERDSPDLCADRIDYSLREFSPDIARACVAALTVSDNRIVFANKEAAILFAQHFLRLQTEHWGGFEAVARYRIFADTLRLALKDGTLVMDDFWQNDDFVINKLTKSENETIQGMLQVLRSKSLAHLHKSDQTVYKKFRHVNPHFIEEGKLVQLNEASQDFALELEQARKANELGIVIPSLAKLTTS